MANIILTHNLSLEEKIDIMCESARYDVSDDDALANSCCYDELQMGQFKAPHSPPKVPKIFMSNNCIFNCAYCGCRASNERRRRYACEPRDMAELAVNEARKNRHGIFITSAIYRDPDYTVERIIDTLRIIRKEYRYRGYIHAKIMPGTDHRLIDEAGLLADRLSINIELPKSEGYALIAKQKNKSSILTPMSYISERIKESGNEKKSRTGKFARSGQTTQMMVGTMNETDWTLIYLAEALYRKYDLRRVYYSAFNPVQECEYLPSEPTPKWRTRRLYQADRLVQLYGFKANDLASETHPNFEPDLDPKASWALRNLHLYPVEVNTAEYEMLIRIPGIGITYANRIIKARKHYKLSHDLLLKMGVSLKRAVYFITCNGKYNGGNLLGQPLLRSRLSDKPEQLLLPENVKQ